MADKESTINLIRKLLALSTSSNPGDKHFAAAFRLGAVLTIAERLRDGMQKFEASSDATRALVVVSDKALTDRVAIDFPKLKDAKQRNTRVSSEGYEAGKLAGKSIPLHKGLAAERSQTG